MNRLNNTQMFAASQLFMAAGKAGKPFDLARLAQEPGYAADVIAVLAAHAQASGNAALQTLCDKLTEALAAQPVRAVSPASPQASPRTFAPDIEATTKTEAPPAERYVGRLR
jgi:hypothetical protein